MVKKYLIRIVGAFCILGAIALMLMPAWVVLDDVGHRDLRELRSDVSGICAEASDDFVRRIDRDEDFQDELRDYDLPYTRGSIKGKFQDVEDLANELMNDTVSIKEIVMLCFKAPGLLRDMENLLDSDCGDTFFQAAARYILREEGYLSDSDVGMDTIVYAGDQLREDTENTMEMFYDFSDYLIPVAVVILLPFAFGVACAATHICNKARWLKYLFLAMVIGIVAGSCVVLPVVSEIAADALGNVPAFAEMTLKMNVTPFIAVVLMIVPVILDIIFERKKEIKVVEE